MKVHVHSRSGRYIGTLDLNENDTTEELLQQFYNKFHYYHERQRYNIGSPKGPVLRTGTLKENNVVDETTLYFKDLGVQISWRLVFVLEYLGPLLFVPLFWNWPTPFYSTPLNNGLERSTNQKILAALMLLHFAKREFESLFVHRFSNATMPLVRLPINCIHYWVFCGIGIGYFLCHPKFSAPFPDGSLVFYFLVALFLLAEALNFRTHQILRNLRPRGTKCRGIPQGCGFQWVSCANYFWESCAWVLFSIMSMTLTSFFFAVVAIAQMAIWALKKQRNYRRTFTNYPRSKKAMIPFIL